jgi:predicted GNAT family acetyltransferase
MVKLDNYEDIANFLSEDTGYEIINYSCIIEDVFYKKGIDLDVLEKSLEKLKKMIKERRNMLEGEKLILLNENNNFKIISELNGEEDILILEVHEKEEYFEKKRSQSRRY